MKQKSLFGLFAVMTALLTASCTKSNLEGKWVEPIPGMENAVQGMELKADGTAQSINMATLQYKNWKQEGNTLILTGQSLGNGMTIDFSDTLQIENCTEKELKLTKGERVSTFTRQ